MGDGFDAERAAGQRRQPPGRGMGANQLVVLNVYDMVSTALLDPGPAGILAGGFGPALAFPTWRRRLLGSKGWGRGRLFNPLQTSYALVPKTFRSARRLSPRLVRLEPPSCPTARTLGWALRPMTVSPARSLGRGRTSHSPPELRSSRFSTPVARSAREAARLQKLPSPSESRKSPLVGWSAVSLKGEQKPYSPSLKTAH